MLKKKVQTTMYKINKDILHSTGEYNHYFKITLNGVKSIKIFNHSVLHLKHCKSTISQLKKKSLKR